MSLFTDGSRSSVSSIELDIILRTNSTLLQIGSTQHMEYSITLADHQDICIFLIPSSLHSLVSLILSSIPGQLLFVI